MNKEEFASRLAAEKQRREERLARTKIKLAKKLAQLKGEAVATELNDWERCINISTELELADLSTRQGRDCTRHEHLVKLDLVDRED